MPRPVKPPTTPRAKKVGVKKITHKYEAARQKIIKRMRGALHAALDKRLAAADDALVQAWSNKYPYQVHVEFLIPEEVPDAPTDEPVDPAVEGHYLPSGLVDATGKPIGRDVQ